VDARWALRAYSGLVPEVRKSKQAVLLAPEVELDGDLVGTRLRPPLEPMSVPGRGFLVIGGVAEVVQLPHVGDDTPRPITHSPAQGPFESHES
jgi:S-DNA-T family DNA segregation ATPase FtsK/SpoIIIE